MKLIYITNTRLPSEKANSYQSMQMCYSFSKVFDEVELWTGKARNTKELEKVKDVFKYYNIEKTFLIRNFFQFDSKFLFNLNEFIWANLRDLIFSVNVCLHLIKYRKKPNVYIYTRVWYVLYVFLFFKKIGLTKNKIFYEGHKFSKFLLGVLKRIDGLVVINNQLSAIYKEKGIDNVLVAHDGVKLSTFLIDDNSSFSTLELEKFSNKAVFSYIGSFLTMGEEKGIEDIIKSIPYIDNPDVCFAFIGGPMDCVSQYLKLSESLEIEKERLIFIDRQPISDLKFYMQKSKALLMPFPYTHHYAYYMSPLKMFEYMTSGVPIIASSLPSIMEVLIDMDNAILCEPDNPLDLANKVQYVLDNDCTLIAKKALADVQEYTWDKRANNIARFMSS